MQNGGSHDELGSCDQVLQTPTYMKTKSFN